MKKVITIIFITIMMFSLVGCKDSSDDNKNHIHSFEEWETTKNPTCTDDGTKVRYCSCGEIQSQNIPALGHTEVIDNAVEPSCSKIGLTEGSHCSECNKIIVSQNEIEKLEHSWVEATCTTTKTCNICGATEGSVKPHNFVEEIISDKYLCSEATDSSPAKYYYSCSICKKAGTETFEYGEPLKDVWKYNYYVDSQFGFTTDEWYLTTVNYIEGYYSNSATTNADLYAEILYDCNDEISIFLYEYGNLSLPVKNSSSETIDYYKIVIRTENGYIYSARGQMHPGGDRIYIIDIYHDAVLNLMRTSDNLQFYIEDETWITTQFKFDVDMNNFNDVLLDVVDGEHLHTYTTTVVEPTCLKEGYTIYSCECDYYFCEDFVPTLDHIEVNGICEECNTVTDAYIALANYVKCNGALDDDGNYSISGENKYSDTRTVTYYIQTNSDGTTLSFKAEEITNINVTVILLTLSNDEETLNHVGMGNSASWGTDYVYGFIDYTWGHKSTNQYIYNYTYDLVYPSQALDYKELFTSYITTLFLGIDLYVLPDFITMEMLGFENF